MRIWKIKLNAREVGKKILWKTGKPRGKKQYQSKTRKKTLNYSSEFKQRSIAIFYEGNSGRAVGRMMGINKSTVYNWIKKLDRKSQPSNCKKETSADETQPVEIIEMDYTKAKKTGLT